MLGRHTSVLFFQALRFAFPLFPEHRAAGQSRSKKQIVREVWSWSQDVRYRRWEFSCISPLGVRSSNFQMAQAFSHRSIFFSWRFFFFFQLARCQRRTRTAFTINLFSRNLSLGQGGPTRTLKHVQIRTLLLIFRPAGDAWITPIRSRSFSSNFYWSAIYGPPNLTWTDPGFSVFTASSQVHSANGDGVVQVSFSLLLWIMAGIRWHISA